MVIYIMTFEIGTKLAAGSFLYFKLSKTYIYFLKY